MRDIGRYTAQRPEPGALPLPVLKAGRRSFKKPPLERDDFSSNRHPALSFCLSMIFSEKRCTLFRIMP
jgi:hypothetical protein